jgi:uncharacterized protein YjbI with pentapeptide repeats
MTMQSNRTLSRRARSVAGALSLAASLACCTQALAASCKAMPAPSVDWQDCNKVNIILEGSELDNANLSGTDFTYTDLRSSSFNGANFEKATMIRSSLAGSKAEKANFTRIEGYRTIFSQVAAAGSTFASAELQRADFTEADLTGADFQKAELGRADFKGATITGARFPMANLSRAHLNAAKFEGPLDFTGAFMFLTRIEGMDLSQATGLEQAQVDQTCGDQNTKLPSGLKPPADWPCATD